MDIRQASGHSTGIGTDCILLASLRQDDAAFNAETRSSYVAPQLHGRSREADTPPVSHSFPTFD